MTIVMPVESRSLARSSSTRAAASSSRSAIGSSRSSNDGWVTSAAARATKLASPADNAPVSRVNNSETPTRLEMSSTAASMDDSDLPNIRRLKAISSKTVEATNPSRTFCSTNDTKAAESLGTAPRRSSPPTSRTPCCQPPAECCNLPDSERKSAVFPEPVGPVSSTHEPCSITRLPTSSIHVG